MAKIMQAWEHSWRFSQVVGLVMLVLSVPLFMIFLMPAEWFFKPLDRYYVAETQVEVSRRDTPAPRWIRVWIEPSKEARLLTTPRRTCVAPKRQRFEAEHVPSGIVAVQAKWIEPCLGDVPTEVSITWKVYLWNWFPLFRQARISYRIEPPKAEVPAEEQLQGLRREQRILRGQIRRLRSELEEVDP